MNSIENATILLTGADSELGIALIKTCLKKGARKIYAASHDVAGLRAIAHQYEGVVIPIVLDITNDRDILKACGTCHDINMLINNAGVELQSSFLAPDASLKALYEMKVNYIGILELINRFLPGLRKKESSSIINILSVGSASNVTRLKTYCASKSAIHILTHSMRAELREQNIHVFGVYPGYEHAELSGNIFFELVSYDEIAENICNGVEEGKEDIFPDEISRRLYDKKVTTSGTETGLQAECTPL